MYEIRTLLDPYLGWETSWKFHNLRRYSFSQRPQMSTDFVSWSAVVRFFSVCGSVPAGNGVSLPSREIVWCQSVHDVLLYGSRIHGVFDVDEIDG